MRNQLGTIANPQYWNPQFKNFFGIAGCIIAIDTIWPSSKNNSFGIQFFYFLYCHSIRVYLTIYIALSHPPGNQLIVLTTKIQYNNHLIFHRSFPILSQNFTYFYFNPSNILFYNTSVYYDKQFYIFLLSSHCFWFYNSHIGQLPVLLIII